MHTANRLINEFKPNHYDLHITINRTARTFTGTATITGLATQGNVVLHAKGLEFTAATINGQQAAWEYAPDDEVSLRAPNTTPGDCTVIIEYKGTINDQLHGLYPCRYQHDGQQKELLATQFESHYAREVFPCVDEPAAKATFGLTLTTETGVTALSNMPVTSQEINKDAMVTTFATTPVMSTYLLAFVIGDLQKATGSTKNGTEVNVYATPVQPAKSLDFAVEHAIKTIEFFEKYFDTPYPLPKSDQVALPDFANGAMENWGLITYRESALLYDPDTTSIASKQYIATVISHELSHQWFGNLVTMAWWDDLWLNESFATVMEYVCVDALYPEWNAWLEFNTNESMYALRRDSLDGVQPVKVAVHHPDEIQSVFDGAIVYAKGARLMRMLQAYVGEETFKAGLSDYFKNHAYGNTTGQDLWDSIARTSDKDVGSFMNAWLAQSGFPVVSVDKQQDAVKLTQKQFFIGPHAASAKVWPVPIATGQLFDTRENVVAYTNDFRINPSDTSHFITLYDTDLMSMKLSAIKNGTASVTERAQLIKEQLLLAKSDELSSAALIDLLAAYSSETDEKVWNMMSGIIGDLKCFVNPDTPAESALKTLSRTVATSMYETLGWDPKLNESADDTMLRATIIGHMLYGEDPQVIAEAKERYATQDPETMDPELRDLILLAEVRYGDGTKAIDRLLQLYGTTQSVDLRSSICDALTGSRDTAQLKRLLATLQDTAFIRTQDTVMWYVRLLTNRYSRDMTWDWLRTEWPWIIKTFGGDKSYDSFPRYTAQVLAEREQLDAYRAFFTPMLSDTSLKRAISVGLNDIEARVHLMETDRQDVLDALVAKYGS